MKLNGTARSSVDDLPWDVVHEYRGEFNKQYQRHTSNPLKVRVRLLDNGRAIFRLSEDTGKSIEKYTDEFPPQMKMLRDKLAERVGTFSQVAAKKLLDEAAVMLLEKKQEDQHEDILRVINAESVETQPVRWLWNGRIPLGSVTLIDSDPGTGKTTMACDIAARCSRGFAMPPYGGPSCEPAGVVMLTAEDSIDRTLVPRLKAAEADLSLVDFIDCQERPLSIPEDLPAIARVIREKGVKLVVIDPLMAFLSGRTDSHKDQDIRRALHPLARFAEEHDVAVLVIRHLNKREGDSAMYRGGGSIAIIGAARSAMAVGFDPEDPTKRVLAHVKCNLAPLAKALLYRIRSVDVDGVPSSSIEWIGESELTADEILIRRPKGQKKIDAKQWLQSALQVNPVPSQELMKLSKSAGLAWRTVRRAADDLGVKIEKVGMDGGWRWSLPAEGGQVP